MAMTISIETVVLLFINNIIIGLGVAIGFWIASSCFIRMIRKEMPTWIHEIRKDFISSSALDRTEMIRRKYA